MLRSLIISVVFLTLLTACQTATVQPLQNTIAETLTVTPTLLPTQTAILTATSQPTRTQTPQDTPTPSLKTIEELWDWSLISPSPWLTISPAFLYNGDYLIWEEGVRIEGSDFLSEVVLKVQHDQQQATLQTIAGSDHFRLDPAFSSLKDNFLAVFQGEATGTTVALHVFNLKTGEHKAIDSREGKFDEAKVHHPSFLVMDSGRVVWTAMRTDRVTCLQMFDWKTDKIRELFCAERADQVLEPFAFDGKTLFYGLSSMPARAVTLYKVAIPPEVQNLPAPQIILDLKKGVDYLATDGQLVIWLGSYSIAGRDLYAVDMDGKQYELGKSDNNVEICNGQVFWSDQTEVRAWKSGEPIKVVYPKWGHSQTCSDDWIAFQQTAEDSTGPKAFAVKLK